MTIVCIARIRSNNQASDEALQVDVALLDRSLPEGDKVAELELLEADFFDDECIVIVYRLRNEHRELDSGCVLMINRDKSS